MDVSALKIAGTGSIHVKSAAGEPLYDADGKAVRIIVHSPGSKAFGTVESRQSARAIKRMNENDGKITAPTSEERIAETAEDLAAITVAFENLTDGDKIGPALFEAVYGNPELGFITKQVTKYVADWGNFSAVSKPA